MVCVKSVLLLTLIGYIGVNGIGLNNKEYLQNLQRMKRPLVQIKPDINAKIKDWNKKIENLKPQMRQTVIDSNSKMSNEFKKIFTKFNQDLMILNRMGVDKKEIADVFHELLNKKDDAVKRINDCTNKQAKAINDLSKMVADFLPKFQEFEKKADDCIDMAKNNLRNQDPLRGRGHYRRLQESCVEEAVKDGKKFFENRANSIENRTKHLDDASETVSFCYSNEIVDEMKKKSSELINSLKELVTP